MSLVVKCPNSCFIVSDSGAVDIPRLLQSAGSDFYQVKNKFISTVNKSVNLTVNGSIQSLHQTNTITCTIIAVINATNSISICSSVCPVNSTVAFSGNIPLTVQDGDVVVFKIGCSGANYNCYVNMSDINFQIN